jgi:hypothetical protein
MEATEDATIGHTMKPCEFLRSLWIGTHKTWWDLRKILSFLEFLFITISAERSKKKRSLNHCPFASSLSSPWFSPICFLHVIHDHTSLLKRADHSARSFYQISCTSHLCFHLPNLIHNWSSFPDYWIKAHSCICIQPHLTADNSHVQRTRVYQQSLYKMMMLWGRVTAKYFQQF